jgi:hypothetical protein
MLASLHSSPKTFQLNSRKKEEIIGNDWRVIIKGDNLINRSELGMSS